MFPNMKNAIILIWWKCEGTIVISFWSTPKYKIGFFKIA